MMLTENVFTVISARCNLCEKVNLIFFSLKTWGSYGASFVAAGVIECCPNGSPRCRLMGLLPDTYHCGFRMRRECRERFSRHRLQRKPLGSDPGMHHGTCVTHVRWYMLGWRKRSRHSLRAHAQPAIVLIWQEAHCGSVGSLTALDFQCSVSKMSFALPDNHRRIVLHVLCLIKICALYSETCL